MSTDQRLGNYRILRPLGSGGMGDVFLAEDTTLGRRVALKRLSDRLASEPKHLVRFRREARLLASLNHPNIATLHAVEESGTTPFLVMELVEGQNLGERIEPGPLPVPEVLDMARQLAAALEAAHARDIIHRDLKPTNVMVTPNGLVKVLDFGLAKMLEPETEVTQLRSEETDLTRADAVLGTTPYLSPEQVRRQPATKRSDVWSFGCLLYETLTGRGAFRKPNSADTLGAILERDPDWERLPPDVPAHLRALMAACLDKDPERRPADGAELNRRLKEESSVAAPGAAAGADPGATPSGGARPAAASSPASPAPAPVPAPRVGAKAVLAVAAVAVLAWFLFRGVGTPPPEPAETSIAVLAFSDISADRAHEYFGDGMAEEILNALAKVPELRVAARTSSFAFKGRDATVQEIADALNVTSVLEGSVRRVDRRLTISARLVDAETGFQLWSQDYERELDAAGDILAIQDDIARAIVAALDVGDPAAAEEPLVTQYANVDLEAYELYLRGRYFWNQRGAALPKALEYFQRAVAANPGHAPSHAGVADAYNLLGYYGLAPPAVVFPRAREAALRALELDPDLAEAHSSLAMVRFYFDRDRAAAERGFRRAIELRPDYAPARYWYAVQLAAEGRIAEALQQDRAAIRAEPLSGFAHVHHAWTLAVAGRFDEVERQLAESRDILPPALLPQWNWVSGYAAAAAGRPEETIEYCRASIALHGPFPLVGPTLGYGYALAGQPDSARSVLAQLDAHVRAGAFVSPMHVSIIHIALGEHDRAFELLDEAYETRDHWLATVNAEPPFRPVRDDPRFAALLERMGFPRRDPREAL